MTLQQIESAVIAEFSKTEIVDHIKSKQCVSPMLLNPDSIKLRCRNREIVVPRQVCFLFAKRFLGGDVSLASIGSYWGGFDHATVLHSQGQIINMMDSDAVIRQSIDLIDKELMLLCPTVGNKTINLKLTLSDNIKRIAYRLSEKNIVEIKNELIELANNLK